MSTKRIVFISFMFSVAGLFMSGIILRSDVQPSVSGDMLVRLGKGLFYGMSALSVIFLVLLFIPHAFPAWKKFAKWFIPIATLLFIFYPEPGAGDLFSPYPEQVFKWVSMLYVLASLAIIARPKVTDKV